MSISYSGTSLDIFKGFLISSSIRRAEQMTHTSSTTRTVQPMATIMGTGSFGFGWWYDAQTEGAPALA
jgi:hypothetical protein